MENAEVNEVKSPKGGEPGWVPPQQAVYSKAKVRKECRKYNNKYVGYYGKVYKVENCKRRELDSSYVKKLLTWGTKVTEVDGSTIVMIPEGKSLKRTSNIRSCKSFNNKYVLSAAGDMYFVKNCQRRAFPDWESYMDHSKKRRSKTVLELTTKEYSSKKEGKPMPSILDKVYSQQNILEYEADVIPLKEACRGVNGKLVSYYSKMYKIENCRKRELLNPQGYMKKRKVRKVVELSSEQWISLPDGKGLR